MRLTIILVLIFLSAHWKVASQVISSSLPEKINPNERFIFYLHGGVVTGRGDNAVNQSMPEWGPYEYNHILDSLKSRGFNVISEVRKEGVDDSVYVKKILAQIDTLFISGVKPKSILVIGASAGWNIVLHVSALLKTETMLYVIIGGCWPETYKDYLSIELYGHFLSIIESSDPHGTCEKIFKNRKHIESKNEVVLNTGLSHGFIYKGHREWIDPLMDWYLNAIK